MSDIAIRVQNLGKKYCIRHEEQGGKKYKTLREVFVGNIRRAFARKPASQRAKVEEFWALQDISFDVKRGEVMGIVGRNGAGKSTLLKLLSRITQPSTGRIELQGRVSSLLEVGTGFHQELTGRENIFLNGAIMGMASADIRRKFDEIVAFAEVEKFLDTPVKRYSSGMYMRLAFAVAAHLEPEILIVDEVLAVGDLEFQKKCLGKMEDVSKGGRTVLFVSHNMDAMMRLCSRGVVLHKGKVENVGSIKDAVDFYLKQKVVQDPVVDLTRLKRPHPVRQKARLGTVRMIGTNDWGISYGEELRFEAGVVATIPLSGLELAACLLTITGTEIATSLSTHVLTLENTGAGSYLFEIAYEGWHLVPGRYCLRLGLTSTSGVEDFIPTVCEFEIRPSNLSARHQTDRFEGMLVPTVRYNIRPQNTEVR